MMDDSTIRLHAVISGKVQGVSFRYYTQKHARMMGCTGWVLNRPDGTVEVTAEAKENQLKDLLDWLQHGPSAADVTDVHADWLPATGEFQHFVIAYGQVSAR